MFEIAKDVFAIIGVLAVVIGGVAGTVALVVGSMKEMP